MARSAAKRGTAHPRYRAYTSGPLKGLPKVRYNRVRAALRHATVIRIGMERRAIADAISEGRLNSPRVNILNAPRIFARLPEVITIAKSLLRGEQRYVG